MNGERSLPNSNKRHCPAEISGGAACFADLMGNPVVEDEELARHCPVALPALAKGEAVVVQAQEENGTEHIVDMGINPAGRDKIMSRPVRRSRKACGILDCTW